MPIPVTFWADAQGFLYPQEEQAMMADEAHLLDTTLFDKCINSGDWGEFDMEEFARKLQTDLDLRQRVIQFVQNINHFHKGFKP